MTKKVAKRIKVISVVTRIAMDSAGKQAILISQHLDKKYYDTLLVTGSCESNEVDMSRWIDERQVSHYHIPQMKREIRLIQDFIAWLKMVWLFIREKPDIVHTRTAKAGTIGRIAAIVTGVPVIIHTFDGHVFNGYFGKYKTWFILSVERMLTRFTDTIIAISNSQKEELIRYLNLSNPDKIKVIPIGFDFDNDLKPSQNGTLRDELKISMDDLAVGYIGRLAPIKRVDRLIDAFQMVLEEIPSGKLFIVGDGELRGEIEQLVSSKNLNEKIQFLGVRQDLEKIYTAVDVVALSSDNEGTPAVLIEAMHYGTAVVATNVGGIPDVVKNGISGLLTEANGPGDLAEILIKVLKDRELREKMGKAGMQDVHRRFSHTTLLEKLHKLYIDNLAEKSARLRKRISEIKEPGRQSIS
jgi:glycosyltransferase involved in cell wall biosynthesis